MQKGVGQKLEDMDQNLSTGLLAMDNKTFAQKGHKNFRGGADGMCEKDVCKQGDLVKHEMRVGMC